MEYYRPLFQSLLEAVERVKPGEVIHVPAASDKKPVVSESVRS